MLISQYDFHPDYTVNSQMASVHSTRWMLYCIIFAYTNATPYALSMCMYITLIYFIGESALVL